MFGSKSTPDSKFQIILLSYGWPSSWAHISFSFSHFTPYRGSLLLLLCLFFFPLFSFCLFNCRRPGLLYLVVCMCCGVLCPLSELVTGRKCVLFFHVERSTNWERTVHEKPESHCESHFAPHRP